MTTNLKPRLYYYYIIIPYEKDLIFSKNTLFKSIGI